MILKTDLFLLLLSLTLFPFITHAQSDSIDPLLWEITGPGIETSYLYGTMHIKDQRVFNFSDSVLLSIENCDVFALEVHPDSLIKEFLVQKDFSNETNIFKDILSEEEYEDFTERFEQINGYDYTEVKDKNPSSVFPLLDENTSKPDDKSSFIDLYLFGIAKSLKKELTGLESIENQLELIEVSDQEEIRERVLSITNNSNETNKYLFEEFIIQYQNKDTESLRKTIGENALHNFFMVKRNKEMADSLIQLMKTKKTFGAIGCAHMLGDSSVLTFLHHKGYSTRNVMAKYTGMAKIYDEKVQDIELIEYRDSLLGYSFQVTGSPYPIFDILPEYKMFFDYLTEGAYFFFPMDYRKKGKNNSSEIIKNNIIESLVGDKRATMNERNFTTETGDILEYLVDLPQNMRLKMQIITKNGMSYYLFVVGNDKFITSSNVDKFFNTFTTFEPTKEIINSYLLIDSIAAFTLNFPDKVELVKSEVPNPIDLSGDPYIINYYLHSDFTNTTNFMLAYNDLPAGYLIEDPNTLLTAIVEELSLSGELISNRDTMLHGVQGKSIIVNFQNKYYTKMLVFVRGNRSYKILQQNLNTEDTLFVDNPFYSSFSFLPYQKGSFKNIKSKYLPFEILSFDKKHEDLSKENNVESYFNDIYSHISTNPKSGGVYCLYYYSLDDYFRIENVDSFYNDYIHFLKSWNDTILLNENFKNNKISGKEIIIGVGSEKRPVKYKYWLDGDKFFTITSIVSKEELETELHKEYFGSFTSSTGINFDYYSSKSKEILMGLSSQDTTLAKRAKGALDYYEFKKEDNDLLLEYVQKDYPDDSVQYGIKSKLISIIGSLKDDKSIKTLSSLYQNSSSNSDLKINILNSLIDINSESSINQYLNLFLDNPPMNGNNVWPIIRSFRDSIELIYQNYDKLLSLNDIKLYRKHILILNSILLASKDSTYINVVKANFEQLTKYAMQDLIQYDSIVQEDPDGYHYFEESYQYLILMQKIKGRKITKEFTNKYFIIDSSDYKRANIVATQIINKIPYDQAFVDTIITKLDYRSDIINAYNEIDSLQKVPSKYLELKEFGKLVLYNHIIDDGEDETENITFLEEMNFNDTIYHVFKFSYEYDEEEEFSYLAIVQGLNNLEKNFDSNNIKSYIFWKKMEKNWNAQFKELLEEFNKYAY